MEHKLIQGGEQYLPFARSRIKALRATGLKYASQKFEIDGVSIRVRIAGEHEYIELSGEEKFNVYLVFFTPKAGSPTLTQSQQVAAFQGTDWEKSGKYTFFKTTAPEFKKFEIVFEKTVDLIDARTIKTFFPGGDALTGVYTVEKISPLGFFNKEFVFVDRTSTADSSALSLVSSNGVNGDDGGYLSGAFTGVEKTSLIRNSDEFLSGGTVGTTTYGEANGPDGEGGSTRNNLIHSGWMSGNLVRAISSGGTSSYDFLDEIGAYDSVRSDYVISNSIYKLPIQKNKRKLLSITGFDTGVANVIPGASTRSSFPAAAWPPIGPSALAAVAAPAVVVLDFSDIAITRERMAMWPWDITLLNPEKYKPGGSPDAQIKPVGLIPGDLLRTYHQGQKIFSAVRFAETGRRDTYIFSYKGKFIAQIPNAIESWNANSSMLFNDFYINPNAVGLVALDKIKFTVFTFSTSSYEDVVISVPEAPADSFFIRAFRDEYQSLPRG